MKLNHLTFGQLYRLQHERNLCRVLAAYHAALEKRWSAFWPDRKSHFSVGGAELLLPNMAARYHKVLDFLRGPELKAAVCAAADRDPVHWLPAGRSELKRILVAEYSRSRNAVALARLVQRLAAKAGIPADAEEDAEGNLFIYASTDDLGVAQLHYRRGLPWQEIVDLCYNMQVSPYEVFRWMPRNHFFGRPINPLFRPWQSAEGPAQVEEYLKS